MLDGREPLRLKAGSPDLVIFDQTNCCDNLPLDCQIVNLVFLRNEP
jgi:hypothetical protein